MSSAVDMHAHGTGDKVERNEHSANTERIPLGDLREAVFRERPNRYLAVVDLDGKSVHAHVPDPGRLPELLVPGVRVFVRHVDTTGLKRKTEYDLLLVDYQNSGVLVSIYTGLPNRLIRTALEQRLMPELAGFDTVRHEVTHGRSRFDFRLSDGPGGGVCWVEVKSVSLMRDGTGFFPDAPTVRGRRHVEELTGLRHEGHRAAVIFVAQRGDISLVRPEVDTDPDLAAALRRARDAGVELYGWNCDVSVGGVRLNARIPVEV
jgi:sugar fermentation stimulation protein A